jgi:soluble lytic murein transglycosylase
VAALLITAVALLAISAAGGDDNRSIPAAYAEEIASLCRDLGEDLPLVLAVIQAESRFQADAVSPKGAVGLMQVMPDTARWVAETHRLDGYTDEKLFEREWNLTIGISYISYLRRQFPDSLAQILAAYNAGPNRVRTWLDNGEWDGSDASLDDIPYNETKKYVKKVLKAYNSFRKRYA